MTLYSPTESLIVIKDLKKWYPVRKGVLSKLRTKDEFVRAVDGVTLEIRKGEALSLVGESGCGKTTLARLMLRLVDPTEGTITFNGHDLIAATKREMRKMRTQMQAVFQDPYASLDPKQTILQIISEPLTVNKLDKNRVETFGRVAAALAAVGLNPPKSFLGKFPYELSGGQRQRVALARAIVINPSLIVADEPVSMLDVSIRAEILSLMLELKRELNLTYLFITHDLAVARYISDRMAVMYLGRVVEIGPAEEVCASPVHPYTKALLLALPTTDPKKRSVEIGIKGEVPSLTNIPTGCRFRPRCPYAFGKCMVEPELLRVGNDHYAACYLADSPS
jgi:peptide/nickel transport system ATP-binding protein